MEILDADLELEFRSIEASETIQLRNDVLNPAGGGWKAELPEDDSGKHLGVFVPSQKEPVAVLSLFLDRPPIDDTPDSDWTEIMAHEKVVRFRKFACALSLQGRGIGSKLLDYAKEVARNDMGATLFWCDARTTSQEWYKKRGLIPYGDRFFKGVVEHIRMKCPL
ncbi:GCN5-related N-acetyltransferase [Coprinopsis sp. MPI-PUGE-AT-0042]|nr:GCN5-related N-acetyltransferase [Coprinopsis sp. MPI-PUGE-AT-0042]